MGHKFNACWKKVEHFYEFCIKIRSEQNIRAKCHSTGIKSLTCTTPYNTVLWNEIETTTTGNFQDFARQKKMYTRTRESVTP